MQLVKPISGLDFSCILPNEEEIEKIPRKKSYLFKYNQQKLNPNCFKQNQMRKELLQILPREMNSVEDSEFGIDYYYKGISIDQKFCFGELGRDTIKIRVRKKELLNKSNWTMLLNENREILFFKTKKLKQFVKQNWGLIQKNFVSKKWSYSEYYVRIKDLCRIEKIQLISTNMQKDFFNETLQKIVCETQKELIEETLNSNKTVLDYTKKICFEPNLIKLFRQTTA
jgi:hypothetical protein